MIRPAIAFVVATAAAAPALANDSSAELTSGGLVFVRNDNIEMRSEDLRISAKEVSVRYRFFNKSDKAATVLVAFPMPEIKVEEFRMVVDKGDADSLVSFCGDNVRKIGDTQFEMKKTDFTPDRNLAILILKKFK
jgi:hypothetical protein